MRIDTCVFYIYDISCFLTRLSVLVLVFHLFGQSIRLLGAFPALVGDWIVPFAISVTGLRTYKRKVLPYFGVKVYRN